MDEIIVRATRAVASYPRLRMLAILTHGEQTPTQMAQTLHLPLCAISLHLRVLVTANLACHRKSGARCYYRAESPSDTTTFSGKLAAWLSVLWKTPSAHGDKHLGLLKVRDVCAKPEEALHQVVFEAATAFTDLRRLQSLRYLGRPNRADTQDLEKSLSMSLPAVRRHVSKLTRRGYIQSQRDGHGVVYRPVREFKTAHHRRLFEIVWAAWEQSSRTR